MFTASAVSAAGARSFVSGSLTGLALPQMLVEDMILVGSELATQALLHTQAPFTVRLSLFTDYLRLEVLDGSPSGRNPTPLRVFNNSHRALAVVDALSTQWGVSTVVDGGKPLWALWAVFDLT